MENENTFSLLVRALNKFLKQTFDISTDSEWISTIDDIKSGIEIKGQNSWVLIFSILIASTGLNTSSTAVVIGAMLISPLMGPILGIGLALGINDIQLLNKSIRNFAIMVILSLLTSFLFFSIPLFQNETPELLARTSPNVLDVIIALSGGLALIIALSRQNKSINTIAGVAIATALMPPLCTAGFGLAIGNFAYFGGALFLFTINTIFIATATFFIVKFLKFPHLKYQDSQKEKTVSKVITIVVLAVLVPSVYMFYNLYRKSDFNQKINLALQNIQTEKGISLFNVKTDLNSKSVEFAVLGKNLTPNDIDNIKNEINLAGYADVNVKVIQEEQNLSTATKIEELEKSFSTTQDIISFKEKQLADQSREIVGLQNQIKLYNIFPFSDIKNEIKALESKVEIISFTDEIRSDFAKTDTIRTIKLKFDNSVSSSQKNEKAIRISAWLKSRTKLNSVRVIAE